MKSYAPLPLGSPNRGANPDLSALTLVSRDDAQNSYFNNAISGFLPITAAAGTTILTAASPPTIVVTGSTTQNINLPDVRTIRVGARYHVINLSTGNVAVRTSAGTAVRTLVTNSNAWYTCILPTGTGSTSWNNVYSAITFALAKSLLVNKIITLTAVTDNLTLDIGVVGGLLAHVAYVDGGVTVANLATIPDVTGGPGDRTFVTDALAPAFGAAVVGGGAVFVPVYYDGAAWRVG